MKNDIEIIKKNLGRPLVLIGLMGAGKTLIGTLLARALGWPFIDADHEIESRTGKTIPRIFEEEGEAAFRKLERDVLSDLLNSKAELSVLAPGGGAVMTPQTADLIFENALAIWLKADLPTLLKRTAGCENRPLLKNGNPEDIFNQLIEKRHPVYARAPLTVETDGLNPDEVLFKTIHTIITHIGDTQVTKASQT